MTTSEAPKMTPRDNYLAAARGETPQWVPNYNDDTCFIDPMILQTAMGQMMFALEENGGVLPDDLDIVDCFGIHWLVDDFGVMPDVGNCLIPSIDEWREHLLIPDTKTFDWDAAAEIDGMFIEDDKASQMFLYGPFMIMLNAMGHEEAFISLYSEPEKCEEFFDAITTFTEEVIENIATRHRVDSFVLHCDMASKENMFISPEIYRELVKPFDKRIFDTVKRVSPDTLIEFHMCGYAEPIIDDIVEIGADVWQPAQPMNDLATIKQKYGRKLTYNGAWDNQRILADQHITEEEVRQSVRDTIDEQTANGMPFIFWDGGPYGTEPRINQLCEWANDECRAYGASAY